MRKGATGMPPKKLQIKYPEMVFPPQYGEKLQNS